MVKEKGLEEKLAPIETVTFKNLLNVHTERQRPYIIRRRIPSTY